MTGSGINVVRIWERPVEEVLAAGLPVLPLAPVSRVEPEQVPGVLLAISERLAQETTPEQAAVLWNATRILMGLRYEEEQIDAIIEGVSTMLFGIRGIEESTVYQGILRKGRAEGEAKGEARGEAKGRAEGGVQEVKTALLHLGRKKFGPPDERIETELTALSDLERLHDLIDRILDVSSWDELVPPA